MAWYEDLYESAKDYLKNRYLGDKAVENIVKDVGSVYTGYKSYEDQKRANEALERAYKEYTGDKAATYDTISAALALGLTPMAVSNVPTKKSEITDFTEVQDVAKGGIISLPNKKRKKYATGPEIEDIEEMDEEIITPFDLKNEEGVPIGPMVERIKELKIKVQDGSITEEEIIELRNLESKAMFQMAEGDPTEWLEQDTMPNWWDLMREEGVDYGEQVKSDPQLVKPPWMTQEEWLNFQYGRNQAARGGIMNLRKGGRPGFEDGTDPTKYKFWELVDTEYMDKKSDEKEASINADMEAGMSWDDIKKKYNLKDFEDISIKETERENTDSGNRVKEIFETIKEKVGSISFAKGGRIGLKSGYSPGVVSAAMDKWNSVYGTDASGEEILVKDLYSGGFEEFLEIFVRDMHAQGGRTGYAFGSNGADPERPPIYLPDPNEDPENMKTAFLTGEGTWGIDRAKRIWLTLPDDIQGQYGDFMNFFESTDWHGINMKKGGRIKKGWGGAMRELNDGSFMDAWIAFTEAGMPGGRKGFHTWVINEWIGEPTADADYAKGGRIKKDNGGIMNLGGMEKDYRFTGGFVPIGEYEKKDDVPARLSKNEFVMTADAVRAAGGGNINQGAQKMYNIMKNLEAQPTAKRKVA